jgi:hypothetical protein
MKTHKTWQEKLADSKDLPKIVQMKGEASRWGKGSMVVAAPMEVKELMDRVPKGRLATINDLRAALARKHGTDLACPLTTGIFSWIAANAAAEASAQGKKRVTPYWRTLKNKGELNPKYPGGVAALREHLEAEGHKVVQKGKRCFVADYEKAAVSF